MGTGVGDHGSADDVGPARGHQEDGSFEGPGAGLFAIFDGMGGQSSGEFAVHTAVGRLEERAASWSVGHDHVDSVCSLMSDLHDAIVETHIDPRPAWMTTATLASFRDGWCVIGHVGDSRAYLLRGGELLRLTSDHSWVNEQVKLGVLSGSLIAALGGFFLLKAVLPDAPAQETEKA